MKKLYLSIADYMRFQVCLSEVVYSSLGAWLEAVARNLALLMQVVRCHATGDTAFQQGSGSLYNKSEVSGVSENGYAF